MGPSLADFARRRTGLAGEEPHQGFVRRVGGEEALETDPVERDAVGNAETRQRREELQVDVDELKRA
jgi:hypothetical protein